MIKRNSTSTGPLFVFGALWLALFGQAARASSPEDVYTPVWYQNTERGPNLYVELETPSCAYIAGLTTPWCSHYTPASPGREYDHAHLDEGFDFIDIGRGNTVTVQKVTWSDEDYYTYWTKVEDPTCEYNCHNYAMAGSQGPCILSDSNGSDRWRVDAGYKPISQPYDDSIGSTTDHSWVIDYVWHTSCENVINTVSEKDGAQGAYSFSWTIAGTAEIDDSMGDWESNLYDDY